MQSFGNKRPTKLSHQHYNGIHRNSILSSSLHWNTQQVFVNWTKRKLHIQKAKNINILMIFTSIGEFTSRMNLSHSQLNVGIGRVRKLQFARLLLNVSRGISGNFHLQKTAVMKDFFISVENFILMYGRIISGKDEFRKIQIQTKWNHWPANEKDWR